MASSAILKLWDIWRELETSGILFFPTEFILLAKYIKCLINLKAYFPTEPCNEAVGQEFFFFFFLF